MVLMRLALAPWLSTGAAEVFATTLLDFEMEVINVCRSDDLQDRADWRMGQALAAGKALLQHWPQSMLLVSRYASLLTLQRDWKQYTKVLEAAVATSEQLPLSQRSGVPHVIARTVWSHMLCGEEGRRGTQEAGQQSQQQQQHQRVIEDVISARQYAMHLCCSVAEGSFQSPDAVMEAAGVDVLRARKQAHKRLKQRRNASSSSRSSVGQSAPDDRFVLCGGGRVARALSTYRYVLDRLAQGTTGIVDGVVAEWERRSGAVSGGGVQGAATAFEFITARTQAAMAAAEQLSSSSIDAAGHEGRVHVLSDCVAVPHRMCFLTATDLFDVHTTSISSSPPSGAAAGMTDEPLFHTRLLHTTAFIALGVFLRYLHSGIAAADADLVAAINVFKGLASRLAAALVRVNGTGPEVWVPPSSSVRRHITQTVEPLTPASAPSEPAGGGLRGILSGQHSMTQQETADQVMHFTAFSAMVDPSTPIGRAIDRCRFAVEQLWATRASLVALHRRHSILPPRVARNIVMGGICHAPAVTGWLRACTTAESHATVAMEVRRGLEELLHAPLYTAGSSSRLIVACFVVFNSLHRLTTALEHRQKLAGGSSTTTGGAGTGVGLDAPALSPYTVRTTFEQVLGYEECSQCPLLWRWYLRFELVCGDVVAAKEVFFRGVNKYVYMRRGMCWSRISACVTSFHHSHSLGLWL